MVVMARINHFTSINLQNNHQPKNLSDQVR